MEYRKFGNHYVIRLEKGEEIVAKMKELCEKENVKLASLSGIGAVNKVTAGLFKTKEKKYVSKTYEEDMEIVSLGGNVSCMNGETYLHFHISVANEAGEVRGGHLTEAYISATGELILTEIEGSADREYSEEIGLNLFKF
ncbi:PPC domain-containing DNA-binding protein [Anaerostipes sp.]|uniref:PPC domain-containing DNA-binding protein n=1 Tax=Anaerostipes sp. TaxID=1872530 RepID=UPI0025BBBEBA|nr:PPC domain-containing DNA-binding protein [Anaerostipes sp.]MBS7009487.1 DNA-binding protein [Anaerostipes sp.]